MRKRTRSFDINNNNNNNSNTTNSPMTKRRALSICKPVEVLTLNNATHEFVERTVKQRLPSILKNIIEKNTTEWKKKGKAFFAMTKMRLEELRQEVDENCYSGNIEIKYLDDLPENQTWNTDYIREVKGRKLMEVSTFFVENYFYRRILDAVLYWDKKIDPFTLHKVEALDSSYVPFKRIFDHISNSESKAKASPKEGTTAAVENVDIDITDATKKNIFLNLLHYQLWGNRADLSLSSGVVENHININNNNNNNDDDDDNDNSVGSGKQAVDPSFVTTTTSTTTKAINKKKEQVSLLVDDSHSVWDMLMSNSKKQKKIIIVLDNCGLELLSDILCANSLLTNKICDIVELHCKSTPVFVSDALGKDIEQTITWLATKGFESLSTSLRNHLEDNTLIIVDDMDFYTSPLPYADMPKALIQRFSDADLVIIKGDANYRRLLGEKKWPMNTAFPDALSYFYNVNILALRTLKWPLAVGLNDDMINRAKTLIGNDWDICGRCGTIQFAQHKRYQR